MKKLGYLFMIICMMSLFSACGQVEKESSEGITVSAAASLKDALTEIGANYENKTGDEVVFNFAASGTLEQQIEQGAPTDLFISASQKQMKKLEDKSLIEKDSKINLLKNQLVLIVSNEYKDEISSITDLIEKDLKMSIGTLEVVPAGDYAKETLDYLKIWDKVQNKIVYGKDVKQVLTYVENSEVSCGIVYKSDATISKKATIKQTFEENSHREIVYPAAVISGSENKEAASGFLKYLKTKEAQAIFEKYGFESYGN